MAVVRRPNDAPNGTLMKVSVFIIMPFASCTIYLAKFLYYTLKT